MLHLFSSRARLQALGLLSLAAQTTFAVDPTVQLNYTSYSGTALSNGVTQWLGMRYASPPLGDLRFRAPVDPMQEDGPIEADSPGPICLGTGSGPPDEGMDEDCLYMNVFAPSNATCDSKLPVYFFIQGGGFNTNSNPNYNGSGLILAGDMDMVVVNFNYRVGPYGFLAGSEVVEDGSINNGLKDQRLALHWVQKYISLFGGNPNHVVLGGASAGAQSIDLQVLAYGGRDDGLFHATAAESQSFPPIRTVNESQYSYDNLVIRSGCASASPDTLGCLRNLTATELQNYTINTPSPGAEEAPLYMFGPTLDFDFITDYSIRQYAQGKFVHVPAIAGDDSDEGTIFVPQDTSSIGESNTFMRNNFPALNPALLKIWNEQYPLSDAPAAPTDDQGAYFRQLAWVYGETRYICPSLFVSNVYATEGVPSWNYRWNVQDPAALAQGLGVTHTIETNAVWGPENTGGGAPDSYQQGGVNYPIVAPTQAYWTSFIRTFDPNTFKLEGSPVWGAWTVNKDWRRLKFQTNSTGMEDVPEAQRARCGVIGDYAVKLGQ